MFPDPETANPDGIVAMGGDLNVTTLEEAYSKGIFPWPHKNYPLLWFSPPQRGVLIFKDLKIPRSTQRKIRQQVFEMTFNKAFQKVIENCAKVPRNGEGGSWITPEMIQSYVQLHKQGKALSVEAWLEGELVGGIYGVLIRGVFSGESMFHKKSEASKVSLVHMAKKLASQGHEWMDIQMVTPLLEKFGGTYLERKKYLQLLKQTQSKNPD